MSNLEIINKAVSALNDRIPSSRAEIHTEKETTYITLMGKKYLCLVEPEITIGNIIEREKNLPQKPQQDISIIYVTINVTKNVLDVAKNKNVNILDCAGNFIVKYTEKNGSLLFYISNSGEKPLKYKDESNIYPIFQDAGLKVIFYLLRDKTNINKPYREIQAETDVAIGTVKNVIDGMVNLEFARVEGRKRYLINIDRLLALWSANYGVNLKHKLILSRMTFRNPDLKQNFQKIELPAGMLWGSEPAASLSTGYIDPGVFTIYSDVSPVLLIKAGIAKPDENGEIAIYKKFWKEKTMNPTVPAVLTYADLMETGNGRCIETAQKMKENELAYLF